ncbi:GNAT family N-acetyltransferase [Chryseobacterium sp. 6424]|uniref:GNAT family N-acetyltransferase n=1 Tax=Chryseobacterium sp. 6424 TaxID=2039166 RepID=UPI000EFC5885|nr:GNAT family N-acetyltransferase [Chryseobacterium sp. 6424]AYO57745.1 GNAT family N-acetyltransferase [Chryseobacterium sp. 6424]
MQTHQYIYRKANMADRDQIWEILRQGIERRKKEGSRQWQDGYPNIDSVTDDINKGFGYVIEVSSRIAVYAAVIHETEPAYENIEGKWLSDDDYMVVHRVAVADEFAGQGLASLIFDEIEKQVQQQQIPSIKVDTNYDNAAMLRIFEKRDYQYCGEVYFRGSARKAFQKIFL